MEARNRNNFRHSVRTQTVPRRSIVLPAAHRERLMIKAAVERLANRTTQHFLQVPEETQRLPYSREIAEFVGTFILVFAGSGSAIANQLSDGAITHVGASFVSGAVLAALIYTFGHISGAHVNPAVTLAFWSSGFCKGRRVLPYLVAQVAGGVLASMLLLFSFGPVANLGATLPQGNNWLQAFVLETVLTFIMMMVVLGAGLDRRSHVGFGGLAIGLTVALEVLIMGPITGGSMNPARSFAPALVGGIWQYQWLYWVAPILGAQLAVGLYQYISADVEEDVVLDASRGQTLPSLSTDDLDKRSALNGLLSQTVSSTSVSEDALASIPEYSYISELTPDASTISAMRFSSTASNNRSPSSVSSSTLYPNRHVEKSDHILP